MDVDASKHRRKYGTAWPSALDVGELDDAPAMARGLAPWFGVVKVGHELYAEAGPEAFDRMHELGFKVFCDLKLHDIPNTVERARAHGAPRRRVHERARGRRRRDAARVRRRRARRRDATSGSPPPVTLAVTVLTSEPDASAFDERLDVARARGCDGVVCSALEADRVRAAGLRSMVPGIRLAGASTDDQARVATPGDAIAARRRLDRARPDGHAAADPAAAAAALAAEVGARRRS